MTRTELEAALRSQVVQIVKAARVASPSPRGLELRTSLLVAHAEAYAEAQRRETVAGAAGQTAP
jgi:hypothetical protein